MKARRITNRVQSHQPERSNVVCRDLRVVSRPVRELKKYPNNPRTHSDRQIEKLAYSIRMFGFTVPIIIDKEGTVLAGHGRLEAAEKEGLKKVPTICIEDMTEAEKRAYRIADNQIAALANWDLGLLATEFQYLTSLEFDFDIGVTGFETAEIDILLNDTGTDDSADAVPDLVRSQPSITQLGDIWLLDKHRLFCGDATDPNSYERLLVGEKAEMVFTDPPYNVKIDGHVSGLGKVKHREFPMASGEMSSQEFTAFLAKVFRNLASSSINGAVQYICSDWRHNIEVQTAAKGNFTELKNICIWNKSNGGMGSLYRSKHEFIFVYKSGTHSHVNNIDLGRHGRYRTNVWDYPGVNAFGKTREQDIAMHPTVKPVALVADAILDCSQRKNLVLDPFSGSGTTIIAAERTGRRAVAMELDAHYVDVTVRRYQKLTGSKVTHGESGLAFDDVAQMSIEEAADER